MSGQIEIPASFAGGADVGGKRVVITGAGNGIGRAHAGTRVLLLVQDPDIRVINAATGELLRDLTIDPTRNYQPTGRPPGPPPRTPRTPKNPEP